MLRHLNHIVLAVISGPKYYSIIDLKYKVPLTVAWLYNIQHNILARNWTIDIQGFNSILYNAKQKQKQEWPKGVISSENIVFTFLAYIA